MFSLEIAEIPRPKTRSQARRLSKEVVNEEVQVEDIREKSPRDRDDAPLQHKEEIPPEFEMADLEEEQHGDNPSDKIIKEKGARIRELKDDLSKANFMVDFLQQENRQLKLSLMQQGKP